MAKPILCPKCGGNTQRKSGFQICRKCEYVLGTQQHNIDWNRYDHGHMRPYGNADEQLPRGRREPRRRYPLKFGENE